MRLSEPWLAPIDPLAWRGSLGLTALRARLQPRAAPSLDPLYDAGPLLLGHRGAMALAPENTLGAFARAVDDGARGVELDVQLSKDGVPIVLHDDTLNRTTDVRGLPRDFTADALDRVDAGSWFASIRPGGGQGARWPREKVPRLDEVLAALPAGSVCNVELKGPTPRALGLEAAVLAVVARHRARVHILVSSFHPPQLLVMRELDATLPVALLVSEKSILPLRTAWAAPAILPEALHPPASVVTAELVSWAHRAGMQVNVWRVPDEAEASRVLDCGADGLIVDDVAPIRRLIDGRGRPRA